MDPDAQHNRCPAGNHLDLPSRVQATGRVGGRRYPTRVDYERLLCDGADLALLGDSALEQVQRHWHASGQNGCAFAQWLAKRTPSNEWAFVVWRAQDEQITETLQFLAGSSPAEMVSILVPSATWTTEAIRLTDALACLDDFFLEAHEARPGYASRRLRYRLPSGEIAWVMAFGPFAWMPTTRQAPMLEFTIRLKPKPDRLYERLNQDLTIAHLADFPAPIRAGAWDRLFDFTLKETRRVLGEEPDDLSAAKQTLAVPLSELSPVVQ